ncbi:MAG: hypothetical protein Q8P11_02200 [bacterium]|nr:hypothetical protein [bacterium]
MTNSSRVGTNKEITLYHTKSALSAEIQKFFDDNKIVYKLHYVGNWYEPHIGVGGGVEYYKGEVGFKIFQKKFLESQK